MKKIIALLLISSFIIAGCEDEKIYIHVGPNWDMVHKLEASKDSFNVSLSGVKSNYKLGENLKLEVKSEKAGKLWIVQVDSNDEVTLLMPNQLQMDNAISANVPFNFPPAQADWSASAGEPVGESVLAFIVTTSGVDLNQVFSAKSNNNIMQKTFYIIEDEPAWGLQTKVINVK